VAVGAEHYGTSRRHSDAGSLSVGLSRRFELYEDDGQTTQYQQGAFATTEFASELLPYGDAANLVLDIGQTDGSYEGQAVRRTYLATIHGVLDPPRRVRKDGIQLPQVPSYDDLRLGTKAGPLTVSVCCMSGAMSTSIKPAALKPRASV